MITDDNEFAVMKAKVCLQPCAGFEGVGSVTAGDLEFDNGAPCAEPSEHIVLAPSSNVLSQSMALQGEIDEEEVGHAFRHEPAARG